MDGGLRAGAVEVVAALRRAGHEALWAGGCVRDLLMGHAPKDYDVATDATPAQVIALFERTVAVGAQFGVVLVLLGGHEYEVATFRADLGYSDGRRPDGVRWADAREDVLRRDFTINGLLFDPLGPIGDELRDFVGGQADLKAGLVRAIGDPEERFAEDRLRLLRAVRFAARFDFAIEPQTWQAVLAHAGEIGAVSAERVRGELERVLCEGGAARGLTLLAEAGLLAHVLPELTEVARAAARFVGVGPLPPASGWATALCDVAPMPAAMEALGRRLRMSRELVKTAGEAAAMVGELARYDALGVVERKRLLRLPEAPLAREVAARAVAAGQLPARALAAAQADAARWGPADLAPAPLLRGADLIAAGYPPGPGFAVALEALEAAQLAGQATGEEQAWAIVAAALAPGESSERP